MHAGATEIHLLLSPSVYYPHQETPPFSSLPHSSHYHLPHRLNCGPACSQLWLQPPTRPPFAAAFLEWPLRAHGAHHYMVIYNSKFVSIEMSYIFIVLIEFFTIITLENFLLTCIRSELEKNILITAFLPWLFTETYSKTN